MCTCVCCACVHACAWWGQSAGSLTSPHPVSQVQLEPTQTCLIRGHRVAASGLLRPRERGPQKVREHGVRVCGGQAVQPRAPERQARQPPRHLRAGRCPGSTLCPRGSAGATAEPRGRGRRSRPARGSRDRGALRTAPPPPGGRCLHAASRGSWAWIAEMRRTVRGRGPGHSATAASSAPRAPEQRLPPLLRRAGMDTRVPSAARQPHASQSRTAHATRKQGPRWRQKRRRAESRGRGDSPWPQPRALLPGDRAAPRRPLRVRQAGRTTSSVRGPSGAAGHCTVPAASRGPPPAPSRVGVTGQPRCRDAAERALWGRKGGRGVRLPDWLPE